MKVILQRLPESSAEVRSIRQLAAVRNNIDVIDSTIENLKDMSDLLNQGAMPVGSVAFVQEAMRIAGIKQPEFDCYDTSLPVNLYRRHFVKIEKKRIHDYSSIFCKPIAIKKFTGFVYRSDAAYNEFEAEQCKALLEMDDSELIYICHERKFVAEWRCYLTNGELVAICQYDDSEKDLEPDMSFVKQCIECIGTRTLAIDIGLLDDVIHYGDYAVVELNDAWAIGKYSGISSVDYFNFLATRWTEITNSIFN